MDLDTHVWTMDLDGRWTWTPTPTARPMDLDTHVYEGVKIGNHVPSAPEDLNLGISSNAWDRFPPKKEKWSPRGLKKIETSSLSLCRHSPH